jgi:hypothetical protein
MSAAWATVLAVGAATVAIKASGPLVAAGRELPGRLSGVVDLLAPALLSALVVTQTVGGDMELVVDERLAGLTVAAGAIALRAPVLVVVVSAAVTAAMLRTL